MNTPHPLAPQRTTHPDTLAGPGGPHATQSGDPQRTKPADRLLRRAEVQSLTGLGKSSLYAKLKTEPLLRPVQISGRSVAWPQSRVSAWIEKVKAADQAEALQDPA